MHKRVIITISYLLLRVSVNAQDFNYSQYLHAPLNINPALVSAEDHIKVTANYHQNLLWKSLDMKNYQLSATYPLNFTGNERIPEGIGLSLMRDNTGKQGLVNCTGLSLAFSQGVQIGRASFLSAGLMASYYLYNNTDPGNYTTGNQWVDGYGYDPLRGTNEQINFETIKLFSISTGINWYIKDGASSKGNIGVAFYHLNKPEYTFLNDNAGSNNKLETKYIIHGNYRLVQIKKVSLHPRALLIFKQKNVASFGALINYAFKSDNPFLLVKNCDLQLGLGYRNDRSGVVSLNIEQARYLLGVSYAVGLNSKSTYSNYKSNFEVCFAFKFNKNKKSSSVPSEYSIGDTRLIFDKGIDKQKPIEYIVTDNYNSDSVVVKGEKYEVQLRQDFKFKFNDATLTDEANQYLDDLANMLKQNPRLKVEIIGHTDDVGTDEANLLISERRAKAVMDYLVSKDIKPGRLKLTAKGKSEPIFPNDTDENRAKNRRVEFKIYNE